jgi:hypothetical protein
MRYGQAKTVLVAAAVIALAGCGASAATTGATAVSTATTSANPTTSAAATTAAASGSFKVACPSTAEITSTLAQTYPAPKQQSGGGTLTCTYSNSQNDVLVVLFAATPNVDAGDVKIAMDAQAKGQKATAYAVSGLGDGAYEFSYNVTGQLETIVDMLSGSEDIDITAQASAAETEALAHDILG